MPRVVLSIVGPQETALEGGVVVWLNASPREIAETIRAVEELGHLRPGALLVMQCAEFGRAASYEYRGGKRDQDGPWKAAARFIKRMQALDARRQLEAWK